jgi:4,5-dihydroxyphthalate decarboxylase
LRTIARKLLERRMAAEPLDRFECVARRQKKTASTEGTKMETVRLTAALQDYDHVRDLMSGMVRAQGITILPLHFRPYEMFFRFMKFQEWELSELSFGYYCSMVADGDDRAIAIPVFPSRVFRHSSVYVRADGPVKTPQDLAGKRIGIAEWGMTAVIYVRGWMTDKVGIPLSAVQWVQGGVNEAGRTEKVMPALPDGVKLTIETTRSLSEMLLAGDIDAIFCAAPPAPFIKRDKRIVRLFPQLRPVEEAYFKETGIYPIMHVVVIRKDVYQRDRWIARSLCDGFEEAKKRSVERLLNFGSHIPLPWCYEEARNIGASMFPNDDYWPYGVEPNRKTLEAFLDFCHAQGISRRRVAVEELFAPETLVSARE